MLTVLGLDCLLVSWASSQPSLQGVTVFLLRIFSHIAENFSFVM